MQKPTRQDVDRLAWLILLEREERLRRRFGCRHLAAFDAGGRPPSAAPTDACFPLSEPDRMRHTPENICYGLTREQAVRVDKMAMGFIEQALNERS